MTREEKIQLIIDLGPDYRSTNVNEWTRFIRRVYATAPHEMLDQAITRYTLKRLTK